MTEIFKNFESLKSSILMELAASLRASELTTDELTFLAYVLSKAENVEELETLTRALAKKYDSFANIVMSEKGEIKKDLETRIHSVLADLITKDPALAAKLGAEAAKQGATIESLKQQFPDLPLE